MLRAVVKNLPTSTVLLVAYLAPLSAQRGPADHTGLDHLIIGVPNLPQGIRDFGESTGVRPIFGGMHPGLGTQNALASLGSGRYLELLAPVPDSILAPARQFLTQLEGPVPVGFGIATDNLDATARRLATAGFRVDSPSAGARTTSEGRRLTWRSASLPDFPTAVVPFLIEWGPSSPHPSTTSPGGCTLSELEIDIPDAPRLRTLLEMVHVTATVRSAPVANMRVTLQCPRGRVILLKGARAARKSARGG